MSSDWPYSWTIGRLMKEGKHPLRSNKKTSADDLNVLNDQDITTRTFLFPDATSIFQESYCGRVFVGVHGMMNWPPHCVLWSQLKVIERNVSLCYNFFQELLKLNNLKISPHLLCTTMKCTQVTISSHKCPKGSQDNFYWYCWTGIVV